MPILWPTISKLLKSELRATPALLLAFVAMFVSACSDDNDPWPAYIYHYADVGTDNAGRAASFTLDDGTSYEIANIVDDLKADTTLRCVVGYEVLASGAANVIQMASVVCSEPRLLNDFDTTAQSPIEPEGIWRAGKYINMSLTIKGFNGKHTIAFIHDSIVTEPTEGLQRLYLTLRHTSTEPFEAYTRHIYASCRIDQYNDCLQHGRDSVVMHIYNNDYRFPY